MILWETTSDELLAQAISALETHRNQLQALVHVAHERCVQYSTQLHEVNQKLATYATPPRDLRQRYEWLLEQHNEARQTERKLSAALAQFDHTTAFLSAKGAPVSSDSIAQARMLQAQEEERARIARDIHDGLAQVISNAIFQLEASMSQFAAQPEKVRAALPRLSHDLRQGMSEIRSLIADLRRPAGLDLGLGTALRYYLHEYSQRFAIEVSHDLAPLDTPQPETIAIAIFRIVQEALQNVHKHARASHVHVSAVLESEMLTVCVQDNGRGFDPQDVQSRSGKHIGLNSMRERASLIKATLEVQSTPGEGTSVNLYVPVDETN